MLHYQTHLVLTPLTPIRPQAPTNGAPGPSSPAPAHEAFVTKLEHSLGTLTRDLESLGEALLEVGHPLGWGPPCVTSEHLQEVLNTLTSHSKSISACATVIDRRVLPWSEAHVDGGEGREDLHVADVLVRRMAGVRSPVEIRVAVIGNVDSGKSTMVGVLTRSMLDDGRGGARSKVRMVAEGRVSGV